MTATTVGAGLAARFSSLDLEPYPHQRLNASSAPKKQTTRLLKVVCLSHERPYIARMSEQALDEIGFPVCPCGEGMVLG